MKILGIETSCDETAAAVVEDSQKLLANVVASSLDQHIPYGGVVPEVAARKQLELIEPVIEQALEQAKLSWPQIDAIAVSYGPGLAGSLLIGVMTARTLAISFAKPLIGINHVWSHLYGTFLTTTSLPGYKLSKQPPKFPLLGLIVSGGHSQLVLLRSHSDYQLLGRTLDDAVGEAFDKVAKMLGLPYPGGPSIAKAAARGKSAYSLSVAELPGYDFSFSGLKTAVLRRTQSEANVPIDFPSHQLSERLSEAQKQDLAASFQSTAISALVTKTLAAYRHYQPASLVVAGGVAANQALRQALSEAIDGDIYYPDIKLCTDNAAMVASQAFFLLSEGRELAGPYTLAVEPALQMQFSREKSSRGRNRGDMIEADAVT